MQHDKERDLEQDNSTGINYLKEYGPKLIELGYRIIPIVGGQKYPKEKEWQKINATAANIPQWVKKGYASVGVLCSTCPAIDLDVRDKALSIWMKNKVFEITGESLIRVGQPPKAILPFRIEDEPFRKLASQKFESPNGDFHQVEVLGDGNQWVAYGEHPQTGRPYKWDKKSLLDTPWEKLPTLSRVQAQEIIKIFETECLKREWKSLASGKSTAALGFNPGPGSEEISPSLPEPGAQATPETFEEWDRQQALDPGRLEISHDKIEAALKNVDPSGLDYSEWMKVGMALYHETEGSQEGLEMWGEWSARDAARFQPEDMPTKWATFKAETGRQPVTFRSVLKMAKANQPIKSENQSPEEGSLYVDSTILTVRPPEFLIDEFIENNTTGVIFGETGTYKSFLSLDIAFCVATGTPWKGREVKQGNVFYLAGEGFGGLARRKAAWEVDNKIKIEEGQVHFSRTAIDVLDPKSIEHVKEETDKLVSLYGKPGFIVLDTLAANFGAGDENSSEAMSKFLKHINRYLREPYGCSVLIIHHTGHNNGGRGRGSSALRAGIDFEFGVATDLKDKTVIEVFSTKTKDAERPADMWLRYKKVRIGWDDKKFREINSLVLEATTKPIGIKRPDGMSGDLLDLAEILMDSDQKVDRERLKSEALKRNVVENSKQFTNVLAKLKKRFWAEFEADGEWVLVLNGKPKNAQPVIEKTTSEEAGRNNGGGPFSSGGSDTE